MSLRNPHDPHDKRDKAFDNLPAYVAKGHILKQYTPRNFGCRCGAIFSRSQTRRDAEFALKIHQKAVVEAMEDQQAGRSHYDDE